MILMISRAHSGIKAVSFAIKSIFAVMKNHSFVPL